MIQNATLVRSCFHGARINYDLSAKPTRQALCNKQIYTNGTGTTTIYACVNVLEIMSSIHQTKMPLYCALVLLTELKKAFRSITHILTLSSHPFPLHFFIGLFWMFPAIIEWTAHHHMIQAALASRLHSCWVRPQQVNNLFDQKPFCPTAHSISVYFFSFQSLVWLHQVVNPCIIIFLLTLGRSSIHVDKCLRPSSSEGPEL
jgi:hypothetical protein